MNQPRKAEPQPRSLTLGLLLSAAAALAACGGGDQSAEGTVVATPSSTLQSSGVALRGLLAEAPTAHSPNDDDDDDDDDDDCEETTNTSESLTMNINRKTTLAAALAFAVSACGGGGDGASPTPPPPPPPPPPASALEAEVVVQLKRGVALQPLLSRYNLTLVDQFGQRPIYRLKVASGANADTAVASLRLDTGVRYAERNVETDTPEGSKNDVWLVGGDAGAYAAQWAPQALNLSATRSISIGAGVRVAVLDTGVDATHPNLANQMARTATGAVLGYDFVDDDTDASEVGSPADIAYGHGTHVAGLVALAAPGARVMPVRVLDRAGRGNIWVLAEALGWAVNPDGNPNTDDGAHVINLSLGTRQETDLIETVMKLANCNFDDDEDDFQGPEFEADRIRCANGFAATVVAAAGNSGSATERQYPAAEEASGVLSVAASNQQFRIASFSNFGSWIRVAAPGDNIVSTVPGGGWGTWRGTSMAAPLAAGTAALLIATPAPNVTPGRTALRQWQPTEVVDRVASRTKQLCSGSIKQIDALSALTDTQVTDPPCN